MNGGMGMAGPYGAPAPMPMGGGGMGGYGGPAGYAPQPPQGFGAPAPAMGGYGGPQSGYAPQQGGFGGPGPAASMPMAMPMGGAGGYGAPAMGGSPAYGAPMGYRPNPGPGKLSISPSFVRGKTFYDCISLLVLFLRWIWWFLSGAMINSKTALTFRKRSCDLFSLVVEFHK